MTNPAHIFAPHLVVAKCHRRVGARITLSEDAARDLFGLHTCPNRRAVVAKVIWVSPCGALNLSAEGRDAMVRPR